MKKSPFYYAYAFCRAIGVESDTTSHREKLVSAVGALIGILGVYLVSRLFYQGDQLLFIVASMGASAVLVFAVPHGALSQPWPVIGGNVVSALVGVSVALVFGHALLASVVAVGSAVLVMYYLRCLHPPGGATALLAVIGGPDIAALGFGYVLYPILLNASVMVVAGLAFNALIPWRVYPHGLASTEGNGTREPTASPVSPEDITFALESLGSFTDISAEDLALVYERAEQHAHQRKRRSIRAVPGQRPAGLTTASLREKAGNAKSRRDKTIARYANRP